MSEQVELKPEVKEEIRSFILAVILPSGAILSLVAFLLGFFLNEAARGNAYSDAYSEAFADIIGTVEAFSSAAATFDAELLKVQEEFEKETKVIGQRTEEISALLERAKRAELDANQTAENLSKLLSEFSSDIDIDALSERLASSDVFSRQVIGQLSGIETDTNVRLAELQRQVREISERQQGTIKVGDSIILSSPRGNLYANGGSRAEKQVTLTGTTNWSIQRP